MLFFQDECVTVCVCVWFSFMQKKYRQLPDSLRFTSVTDSPDIVHAKTSYQQCSEVGRSFKVLRDTANIVDVCCDMTMTSCFRLYAAEIVQIWEE